MRSEQQNALVCFVPIVVAMVAMLVGFLVDARLAKKALQQKENKEVPR